MTKEQILKEIKYLELDGLEDEVAPELFKTEATTKEEWKKLTLEEKLEYIEVLEVFEYQDYYIGFYSALEMIKRLLNK